MCYQFIFKILQASLPIIGAQCRSEVEFRRPQFDSPGTFPVIGCLNSGFNLTVTKKNIPRGIDLTLEFHLRAGAWCMKPSIMKSIRWLITTRADEWLMNQMAGCCDRMVVSRVVRISYACKVEISLKLKGNFVRQMALLFLLGSISRHISKIYHVFRIFDFALLLG